MPTYIELTDRVAVEDVLRWPNAAGSELTVIISRSAEFEAGAEGLALAYLSSSIPTATSIHLECQFALPKQTNEFSGTILSSMFGYALLRACNTAEFGSNGSDLAQDLRRLAGRIYDEQQGVVGLGDRVGIIAFDPKRPIPRIFNSATHSSYGDSALLPSQLSTGMSRVLVSMGVGEIASQSVFPLLTEYIFETFANTLHHGRPIDPRVARHSTRGISITKIVFNAAQLDRRQISEDMRLFLHRIAEMERTKKDIFLACISVMDMGAGIQNTLPPASTAEDHHARLLRAFNLLETRIAGGNVARGIGLRKVVEAAFRLGARLQVTSAGQRIVKDFSLGEDRLPDMSNVITTDMPRHFTSGTCIDLYVPQLLTDIDQRELAL